MKCTAPSCNAELKENAKFCTKCGTPVKRESTTKSHKETSSSESNGSTATMNSVKGMIFWDVQQGDIARRINESEFIQYDSATGLIINDGTTAYIRSGGVKIAELDGGVYNFIEPKELEELLESRSGGLLGRIKRGWRGVVSLFAGERLKDNVIDRDEIHKQTSLDAVIECMRKDSILSLTLKLNKDFELLFGASHSNVDEYSNFVPMTIRTKYLDIQMGVRAMFKITNFSVFLQHYLADKNNVSTSYLADVLTPVIQSTVQNIMNEVEITDHFLPNELKEKIMSAIIVAANSTMYGISLTQVVEMSLKDDDIDRLRALSRELYLSEKELDLLVRTNDFKNRLNTQVDQQDIYDSKRELERESVLHLINKDKIFDENEFNKFIELLELENRLRQARNQEEENILNEEIATRGFEKIHAFNLRQNQAASDIETLELERVRKARLSTTQTDVDEQRLRDDYKFEANDKVDKRTFRNKERENEIINVQADSAIERLRKIKEMEGQSEQDAHSRDIDKLNLTNAHEIDLNRSERERLDTMSNLSPEQLMAIAANENMSPEAAAEFSKSFSEKHKSANAQENLERFIQMSTGMNQERNSDREKEADRMERMMRDMMATASNIAGASSQNNENIKNEYKERLERQEDRMDNTQDRALDYSTKNNAISRPQQGAINEAQQQSYYQVDIEGKENDQYSFLQITLMIKKGLIKADTYVFFSSVNDWRPASSFQEISKYFSGE